MTSDPAPRPLCVDPFPFADRLPPRAAARLDTVVLHCTELPTLDDARATAERSWDAKERSATAAHVYVDRTGHAYEWADPSRLLAHTVGHNKRSIGIELVNRGRYPDWFATYAQLPTERYPSAQIDGLLGVLATLTLRYPNITRLARHSDLDQRSLPSSDDPAVMVRRRIDPGPLFPWERVLAEWARMTRTAASA